MSGQKQQKNSKEERVKRLTPHRFRKGQSGNSSGRPRKFETIMAKQFGLSRSQVNDIIQGLLGMTDAQRRQIIADPQANSVEKLVAKAIDTDLKAGRISTLETILSRTFGTPKQEVNINAKSTVKNVTITIPDNEHSDEKGSNGEHNQ